jgi:hypothetical protein
MQTFISSEHRITLRRTATAIGVALASAISSAAPTIPNTFVPVLVDGSATAFATAAAQGMAFNVLYDGGVYHLWYRTDAAALSIGEMRHATSTDGINFATAGGAFSFATNPFTAGTAPALYYEAVSKVGSDFKLVHWTYNTGAGAYPAYDYNNSVSTAGASAANTVVTHQGALGGGSIGQTAGAFGIVGGNWYGQCGTTGQEICRSPYTDGTPPTVAASIYPSALNASSLFTSLGIAGGYINNHGDVNTGATGLDVAFTVRTDQSSGARFNKQVYYANSLDNGASWSAVTPLITGTPLLNGGAFGAGNFAHPELVLGAAGFYKLYVSAQDAQGNFVIAVAGNSPVAVAPATPVPATDTGLLAALAGMLLGAGLWMRRRVLMQRRR